MTQARMLAFRLAAGALIVAAGAAIVLADDGMKEPPGSSRDAARPVPPPPTASERAGELARRGTEPPDPPTGAGQRDRARSVARRFLAAFLRYQAGRLDRTTRRALSATSTPALASTLLRRPPRPTRSLNRSARVRRLAVVGPFAGRLKAVVRLAYQGAGESLLELALEQRGGRLRVTRLYP